MTRDRTMKKSWIIAGITCLVAGLIIAGTAAGVPGQTDREKALASLIEAERSFSRASEEKGIREAFLTWLAPDAVVFRPAPVKGRPIYEKMDPANPAVLTWEPEFAEIAASGKLGYTTGPYELRPSRDVEPTGFGHYVSVWKKQPNGSWRVLLDIGVQHGPPGPAAGTGEVSSPAGRPQPIPTAKLRDIEYAFRIFGNVFEKVVGETGLQKVMSKHGTEDVRVFRSGQLPAVGLSRAVALIPPDEGKVNRARSRQGPSKSFTRIGISRTGDLVYSYGSIGSGKAGALEGAASFLRIWRRDMSIATGYRICLDIRLPIPPEKGKTSSPS